MGRTALPELIGELDLGELANGREVFRSVDHEAQAGALRVVGRFGDDLRYGPWELTAAGGVHGLVSEDKRDLEGSGAGSEVNDVAALDLEANGPAVLRRQGFPFLDGDGVFLGHPLDELRPGIRAGAEAVSYTHLDVYKRQMEPSPLFCGRRSG